MLRAGVLVRSAALLLALVVSPFLTAVVTTASLAPAATAAGGNLLLDQTFQNATVADQNFVPLNQACLTGAAANTSPPSGQSALSNCPSIGVSPSTPNGATNWGQSLTAPTGTTPGYLQLTDNETSQQGGVLYNQPLPTSAGLQIQFQQYQFGGTQLNHVTGDVARLGADGIGFFLTDGSAALSATGAEGGGLGYSQRIICQNTAQKVLADVCDFGNSANLDGNQPNNLQPGVANGVLGVGLDWFGNGSNDDQGRGYLCGTDYLQGTTTSSPWERPPNPTAVIQGFQTSNPNAVVVRGPEGVLAKPITGPGLISGNNPNGNGVTGYCLLGTTVTLPPDGSTPGAPNNGCPLTITCANGLSGELHQAVASNSQIPTAARNVEIILEPPSGGKQELKVFINFSPTVTASGQVDAADDPGTEVLDMELTTPLPPTVKFGLSASTGGAADIHLIRNLTVSTVDPLTPGLNLVKQVATTDPPQPTAYQVGQTVPYQFVVTNTSAVQIDNAQVSDSEATDISCPATGTHPAGTDTVTLAPAGETGSAVECTGQHTLTPADVEGAVSANPTNPTFSNDATVTDLDVPGVTATSSATVDIAPPGSLTISKTIAGNGAGSQAAVTLAVMCTAIVGGAPTFTGNVTIPAGTLATTSPIQEPFPNIPAGSACTVTEPEDGSLPDADVQLGETGLPITIDVASDQNAMVPATDTYNLEPAVLTTTKSLATINGDPANGFSAIAPGDVLGYNITVTDSGGPGTTQLVETVPPNTTFTGDSGSEGWSCAAPSPAGTTCTQTVNVPLDGTVTVHFHVTAAPNLAGVPTISNTVSSTVGTCEPCTTTNPTVANLSVAKGLALVNGSPISASAGVKAGDLLSYNVVVTNSGGAPGGTTLTETVPDGTTFVPGGSSPWMCTGTTPGSTCTFAVAPVPGASSPTNPGSSDPVIFQVMVNAFPPGTLNIVNTVAASSGTACPPVACTVTTSTEAVLSAVKTLLSVGTAPLTPATPATPVGPGDVLTYGISITNSGGATAAPVLTETVPQGTTFTGSIWVCTLDGVPSNAAGATCTRTLTNGVPGGTTIGVSFQVTVNSPLPPGTTAITNSFTPGEVTCASVAVCTATNPTVANLAAVKTLETINGNPAGTSPEVGPNNVLGYQITVTNSGGSTGTTRLTETVPANTTFTGPAGDWSCAVGSAAHTTCTQDVTVPTGTPSTFPFDVTVTPTLPTDTDNIVNTVTSTPAPGEGSMTTSTVTTPTVPVLDTVKTLATINANTPGPNPQVGPNDVVVYHLTVTDSGGTSDSTILTETVPANTAFTGPAGEWSCAVGSQAGTMCTRTVPVTPNDSVTVSFQVTVNSTLPAGTRSIVNTTTSSEGACSSCTVSTPTVANLNAEKTLATINGAPAAANPTVAPNDVLAYHIVVTNSGGTPDTTTLTEIVPANTTFTGAATEGWSCATGSAAGTACTQNVTVPAGSQTVTFTVTAAANLDGTASIVNTVTSSVGSCSSCTVTTPVAALLDTVKNLVTVDGVPAGPTTQIKPGDNIVYRNTVTNRGGGPGTTILTETVPAHTTFVGGPGEHWVCTPDAAGGSKCTESVSVSAGGSVPVTFTVTAGTNLDGVANITSTVTSSVGTCSACTVITPTLVLHTTKVLSMVNGAPASPTTTVGPNGVLVYQITVANVGGGSGTTTLTETVPAGTSFTGSATEHWSCVAGSPPGTTCTQAVTVAAGARGVVTFTVTAAAALPEGASAIVNTVTSSVGTCASCTVRTPTMAQLATTKSLVSVNGQPTPRPVGAGDVIAYQITVTNGGGTSGTTTLTEVVPANTTFTGAASAGWSCATGTPGGRACTQAVTVAGGATARVAFTVTVVVPLPDNTATIDNTVTSSVGTCSVCTVSLPTVPVLHPVKSLAMINGNPVSAVSTVAPGDVLLYHLLVTNTGAEIGPTTLVETVPDNTTFTGTGWTCNGTSAGSTCSADVNVSGISSTMLSFQVTVAPTLPPGATHIVNNATSTAGPCDCTVMSPTVAQLDTVKSLATVNGKVAGPTSRVGPNDVLVYAILVTNGGGTEAATTVTDTVPANTSFVGADWACSGNGAAGSTCTKTLSVPGSGEAKVPFTVKVVPTVAAGTTTVTNTITSSMGTCSACTVNSPLAAAVEPQHPNQIVTDLGAPPGHGFFFFGSLPASVFGRPSPLGTGIGGGLFALAGGAGLWYAIRRRRRR